MKTTYQIQNEISHTCDGHITPFVLMSRAAQAVAKGDDAESVANALYNALYNDCKPAKQPPEVPAPDEVWHVVSHGVFASGPHATEAEAKQWEHCGTPVRYVRAK